MAGWDNGTCNAGIVSQAKQFGSILRGLGPPVPQAGVLGDVYLDTLTWQLFEKRASEQTDPWGHYLFVVPLKYRACLKFFTAAGIGDDVGMPGDCALLWAGYSNYGLQPMIFGPKGANSWPENGNGPGTQFDPASIGSALALGIVDDGPAVAYSVSTQLVVEGLTDEFILAIPAAPVALGPVSQLGVQGQPVSVTVALNPLYTAQDGHELT